MSSAGGVPTAVTTLADGEDAHRWPHFLPDGRHFFYTAVTGACCPAVKPGTIKIGSLDQDEPAVALLQADSSATYASNHMLFARDQTLMAQAFDPDARQLTGDAVPVMTERVSTEGSRYVSASVSENGTLVYAPGGSLNPPQLTWFDRDGKTLGTLGEGGVDVNLSLSPDEQQVAVALRSGSPESLDIWTIDIARKRRNKVTFDAQSEGWPVWSRQMAHASCSEPARAALRRRRRRRAWFRLWSMRLGRMKRSSKPWGHRHGHVVPDSVGLSRATGPQTGVLCCTRSSGRFR